MKVYLLVVNGEPHTDKPNTGRMWTSQGACRAALMSLWKGIRGKVNVHVKPALQDKWEIVEVDLSATLGAKVSAWDFLTASPQSCKTLKKHGFEV